jgi:HK97 family phage major capsid protein
VTKTQRANTYTAGAQTQFISTVTSPDVIKYLYNRARLMQLGAKRLAGIQGLLKIPVMNSISTSNWLAEAANATPSNPGSSASVTFKPNRLSIQGILTMELLAQTSPDVEAILIADQEEVAALSLDFAGIQGTGTGNQPLGILNTTGVGSVVSSGPALTSGGLSLDYTDIVNFEKLIAVANADSANMGWMLTPETRAVMKTTPKIGTTFPVFLWPDQFGPRDPNGIETGPMGYKAGVTNQLPKNLVYATKTGLHAAIFGDFSTVIIGDWGTMDVIVDPYTNAGEGEYIITRNGLFDVELRHPQKLAACLTAAVA